MTTEQKLAALDRANELRDGTKTRDEIVDKLLRTLIERPDEFWNEFFSFTATLEPSYRQAERLITSGAVHGLTRISDLPDVVQADFEEQQ